jgi:hypothetical protein
MFMSVIALVSALGPSAAAHGWYPHECCHDHDCGPVIALDYLKDGSLRVTTEIGTATVPAGYPAKPSPDGLPHACVRQIGPDEESFGYTIICLFLPGIM